VSASLNLPLHHKVQKFSSGIGSPGWSRKKGRKTVVCGGVVWLWLWLYYHFIATEFSWSQHVLGAVSEHGKIGWRSVAGGRGVGTERDRGQQKDSGSVDGDFACIGFVFLPFVDALCMCTIMTAFQGRSQLKTTRIVYCQSHDMGVRICSGGTRNSRLVS